MPRRNGSVRTFSVVCAAASTGRPPSFSTACGSTAPGTSTPSVRQLMQPRTEQSRGCALWACITARNFLALNPRILGRHSWPDSPLCSRRTKNRELVMERTPRPTPADRSPSVMHGTGDSPPPSAPLTVRRNADIYGIDGGWFQARWHFSFDQYHDPSHMGIGRLRVFNHDTLTP